MKTKLIPTLLWPKETVKSTEMLTVLTLNFVVRLLRKAFVFTGYACARSSMRSSEVLVLDEFGRSYICWIKDHQSNNVKGCVFIQA